MWNVASTSYMNGRSSSHKGDMAGGRSTQWGCTQCEEVTNSRARADGLHCHLEGRTANLPRAPDAKEPQVSSRH